MKHSTLTMYPAGVIAGVWTIAAAIACGSEVDDGHGADTDQIASSRKAEDATSTAKNGAETDAAPGACEEAACASVTVSPEQTSDGELIPIPCSFSVPPPPDGQRYGGVTVSIKLGDGSAQKVPLVQAEAQCETAEAGWYYAGSPPEVALALCPQTCAEAVLGLEARYHCQPITESTACPHLDPPPGD